MNVMLTDLRQEHLPQIAALERLCFSDPWNENMLLPELSNPLSLWICAMDGDMVVGYVGSQSVLGEADMMNLAVAPDHRRQGIARMLVLALCNRLSEEQKAASLTLEVRDSNEAAIRLYDSLGFRQVGLRRQYYRNPKEDARILRKELI